MRIPRVALFLSVALASVGATRGVQDADRPSIAYTLRLDAEHLDVAMVTIRCANAPSTFRLAMKVHPEYDAKYWRFIDSMRVDGTTDDHAARVARVDSTLWDVALPGGRGSIHYRVHIQAAPAIRRAWMPFAQATGALINGPDFFLYSPELAEVPATIDLLAPTTWRVVTSLAMDGTPTHRVAPNAAALFDAPILLGVLREWSFHDRGTTFHVAYWPLPNAAPFDTVAFVDELHRLAGAAIDLFRRAPVGDFYFLMQDGAGDALEHAASVTIGVQSAALTANPRASLTEITHEFFHTWNLVAIHPDNYGALSFRPPHRTSGLWWGEGITLYYADALPRRAALTAAGDSRLDHLARLLRAYYAAPWRERVSPERASLAFGDSPVDNSDATGSYYLQGELLGHRLDALIRDSTRDARGLDDVMRRLFDQSIAGRGFTSADLESAANSACGCRLDDVFRTQVRGASSIDLSPLMRRLGLRLVVDTVVATDSTGAPLSDVRVGTDFSRPTAPLTLVVNNPASRWSAAGLRTGDALMALNGAAVASAGDFQTALRTLKIGDTAMVNVRRNGAEVMVRVPIGSYVQPRVQLVDEPAATSEQKARRARWLDGW